MVKEKEPIEPTEPKEPELELADLLDFDEDLGKKFRLLLLRKVDEGLRELPELEKLVGSEEVEELIGLPGTEKLPELERLLPKLERLLKKSSPKFKRLVELAGLAEHIKKGEATKDKDDRARASEYKKEFEKVHRRSEEIRKFLSQGVEKRELGGKEVKAGELIDQAIGSSEELREVVKLRQGGIGGVKSDILYNLEIIAIDDIGIFEDIERAVEEMKKAEKRYQKLEQEIIKLAQDYGVSKEKLARAYSEKDREEGEAAMIEKIKEELGFLRKKGWQARFEKLKDKKEELEKLLKDVEIAAKNLADAIIRTEETRVMKFTTEHIRKETKKKETKGKEREKDRFDEMDEEALTRFVGEEELKVTITKGDQENIEGFRKKVRNAWQKKPTDRFDIMERGELVQLIGDEKLGVKVGRGDTKEDIARKIRKAEKEKKEQEEKERKEFLKKLDDPEFVLNFLYKYIERRYRGDDAKIATIKAEIDKLDKTKKRAYAMRIIE